jgi:DNA-binding response OmpR family regulator
MNSDIRLLIVDPSSIVRAEIRQLAVSQGYSFDEAADGIAALKLFRRNDYNLIVMDPDLPELDGGNVCRQIRKVSEVPVLFISARTAEQDRLCAFEVGADDFILKPFYPRELLARIRCFLRTGSQTKCVADKIAFNGLFINTVSREVTVDDAPCRLRRKNMTCCSFFRRIRTRPIRASRCSTRFGDTALRVRTAQSTRTSAPCGTIFARMTAIL